MPLIKKYGLREPYFYMNFPPPTLKIGTGNAIRTFLKILTTRSVAEKVRDARSVLFLNRNRALTPLLISTFLGFEQIRTLSIQVYQLASTIRFGGRNPYTLSIPTPSSKLISNFDHFIVFLFLHLNFLRFWDCMYEKSQRFVINLKLCC
jgi:hypothetical protein